MRHALAPFLVALALACSAPPVTTVFNNEGGVCLVSEPSGALRAKIVFSECIGGCETPTVAVCAVKDTGTGILRISSRGEVTTEGGACTLECSTFTTTCTSAPIAPGPYTVTYGDRSSQVTLPTTGAFVFPAQGDGVTCP
jgi:hypothetical protein